MFSSYLLILALILTEQRQVVQLLCHIGMILPENLRPDTIIFRYRKQGKEAKVKQDKLRVQ